MCIETFEEFEASYLNYFNLFYDKVKEHNLEQLFEAYDSTRKQIIHIFHMQDINNKATLVLNDYTLGEKFKKYLNNNLTMLKIFADIVNEGVENKYMFYNDAFNWFCSSTDGLEKTVNSLYSKINYKDKG